MFDALLALGAAALGGAASTNPVARSADGVGIRYETRGRGEPALVLVHGWAFDRHLWDGQIEALARDRRVVTLDLAGHGESGDTRAAWTMEAFGQDVKAVVDAAGVKDAVLAGHSMGGPVVLEAARLLGGRVKGIVLVDTLLDVEARLPLEEVAAMAGALSADYPKATTATVDQYLVVAKTPPAVRERILRQALRLPAERSVAMLRSTWTYDPRPALAAITAPVRAVNADKFPTNVENNRRHMPGFEVFLVKGTGHYPMLEDPAQFDAAFARAVSSLGPR